MSYKKVFIKITDSVWSFVNTDYFMLIAWILIGFIVVSILGLEIPTE